MKTATEARSGKGAKDENFPVASLLIDRKRRGPILAFYRFVRAADDVADHPGLRPEEKLELLDGLEAALLGRRTDPEAEPLRIALVERGLSPKHALELLDAFRLDARKNRYADLDELMDYCRLSAMPVGRFVLDAHGEARGLWPASDALCAALQIINHVQDCAQDYRKLDRVYLPQTLLDAHRANVEMLDASRASPALRGALVDLTRHAERLIEQGATLVPQIVNFRLSLEIAAIEALARRLVGRLKRRDPLSQSVHLGKLEFATTGGLAVAGRLARALVDAPRERGRARA